MLRITTHSCSKVLRLIVEGRLEGAHVIELEHCRRIARPTADLPIIVDLTGITFIDCRGKQLLTQMYEDAGDRVYDQARTIRVKTRRTKEIYETDVK